MLSVMMLNVIMLNVIMLRFVILNVVAMSFKDHILQRALLKKYIYISCASSGSAKANGREPETCLGRVFNYKLGCFNDVHVLIYVYACPYLQLKTRPRLSPVSYSLSMRQIQNIGVHLRPFFVSQTILEIQKILHSLIKWTSFQKESVNFTLRNLNRIGCWT